MNADPTLTGSGTVQPFQYWMVTFNGELLRKQRLDRNLSQQRLAYRSRVSLKTIQRIEKLPAASCRFTTLHRIAQARIAVGRYPCKLPRELGLAEEFGVSYPTVRRAMAILRERGLIVTIHGRGTFVASRLVGNSS